MISGQEFFVPAAREQAHQEKRGEGGGTKARVEQGFLPPTLGAWAKSRRADEKSSRIRELYGADWRKIYWLPEPRRADPTRELRKV